MIAPARATAVLCLLVSACPVSAVTCKSKSGALAERPTCKRKETRLELLQVGLVGPQGDTGEQGPPGAAAPRLYLADATGKRFPGSLTLESTLLFAAGSRTVQALVNPSGFGAKSFELLFEEEHCDGAAYIESIQKQAVSFMYFDGGASLFYAGDPIQMRHIKSRLAVAQQSACTGPNATYYDVSLGACCETFDAGSVLTGPKAVVDLGAWTPPLHAELEQ